MDNKAVLKLIKDEEADYVDIRFTDPRGKWQHLTMATKFMDEDAFEVCLDDGRRMEDVSFNQQAARSLGVRSTPSFFLSNRLISGNQDLEVFQQSIDAELN